MFKIYAIVMSAALCFIAMPRTAYAQHQSDNAAPNIEPVTITRELRLKREPRISDFTGLPVPRFASLRYDEVNGRAGPGLDYPVQWTYRRTGLPVLVVRESQEWTKIRDPEGDEVWVARHMVGGRRTGITATNAQIHVNPDDTSRIIAEIDIGVVMDLADCRNDWCHIRVAGHKGWLPLNALWGAGATQ